MKQCMDNYFNSNNFSFSQACQNSVCNHIIDALCVYVNIQNTFLFVQIHILLYLNANMLILLYKCSFFIILINVLNMFI